MGTYFKTAQENKSGLGEAVMPNLQAKEGTPRCKRDHPAGRHTTCASKGKKRQNQPAQNSQSAKKDNPRKKTQIDQNHNITSAKSRYFLSPTTRKKK